jgi:ribulose-5-phosphate 4-epimerase/fuculose-1-phosphate aldolase
MTLGRTPGEAFMLLYYFERAARIQLDLQAAGAALLTAPHAVCEKAARQFWENEGDILIAGEREWPAFLRQLEREGSDYRR